MKLRTYTELSRIQNYYDRFEYLRLKGYVGEETFGWHRYINQMLYHSSKWRSTRDKVIIRDEGCDLAHPDYEIGRGDFIVIHHMNPITLEDIEEDRDWIYDLEFLICTADRTHKAIHYGDQSLLPSPLTKRRPGDTCPWKKQ